MTTDTPSFDEWEPPEALFDDAPIRERMLDVVVGLRDPATVNEIAERVDCDPETARDYLGWFAEMGMVREYIGRPVSYELNRSYFRWRRIERIRESLTEEEIVSELESTTEAIAEYRERFGTDHPEQVSLLEVDDATDVGDAWEALAAWKTARERAELLDSARRDRVTPGPVNG